MNTASQISDDIVFFLQDSHYMLRFVFRNEESIRHVVSKSSLVRMHYSDRCWRQVTTSLNYDCITEFTPEYVGSAASFEFFQSTESLLHHATLNVVLLEGML